MRSKRSAVAALALAVAVASAEGAPAGPPMADDPAAEKMKALAWLAGDWEGEAWVMGPSGQKMTVQQRERVEWKLDGDVLLIQGRGVQRDAETSTERVVHHALATLAWDPNAGRYAMWAYRAGSGPAAPEATVEGQTLVWGFAAERGRIRFTVRQDDQGRWVERGERSADGTTWNEFFGMTLTRTAGAAKQAK